MSSELFDRWSGFDEPVHGGCPLAPGVTDFSISVNPFPLPQSVKDVFVSSWTGIGSYPDAGNGRLTKAVSGYFGIPEDELLITNGSAEGFSLISPVFLKPGKKAMLLLPGYSDYEHVSRLRGAEIIKYRLKPENRFEIDKPEFYSQVERNKPDLLWLCSPSNPCGTRIDFEVIKTAADMMSLWNGFVVLDEAYTAFSTFPVTDKDSPPAGNIISVRSLTKDFGVPGLRLGFLRGTPEAVRVLSLYKPCWSVSGPAQAAGVALIDEIDYFRDSWMKTRLLHDQLIGLMQELGMDPLHASGNLCSAFVFCKIPAGLAPADFFGRMLDLGFKLRDCTSMGAGGYFRAGVKLSEDNLRLADGLKKVLTEAGVLQ